MSAQAAATPPTPSWAADDAVEVALRAREEVRRRIPWWCRGLRRMKLEQAVEVYVQAVVRAYAKGLVEGWPPGTVDHGLLPRRRRAVRRTVRTARAPKASTPPA